MKQTSEISSTPKRGRFISEFGPNKQPAYFVFSIGEAVAARKDIVEVLGYTTPTATREKRGQLTEFYSGEAAKAIAHHDMTEEIQEKTGDWSFEIDAEAWSPKSGVPPALWATEVGMCKI